MTEVGKVIIGPTKRGVPPLTPSTVEGQKCRTVKVVVYTFLLPPYWSYFNPSSSSVGYDISKWYFQCRFLVSTGHLLLGSNHPLLVCCFIYLSDLLSYIDLTMEVCCEPECIL